MGVKRPLSSLNRLFKGGQQLAHISQRTTQALPYRHRRRAMIKTEAGYLTGGHHTPLRWLTAHC